MNDKTAYWLLRLALGVGVWLAILGGIVIVEGPDEVAASLNEPMDTADLAAFVVGFIIGPVWDMVIAAGLASYIVWGDWRVGILTPRFRTPEPRAMFR